MDIFFKIKPLPFKSASAWPIRCYLWLIFCFFLSHSVVGQKVGINTDMPEGEFHVTAPGGLGNLNFIGTGLNDLTVDISAFSGTTAINYTIVVSNAGPDPNLYDWNDDGSGSGV